MSNDIKHQVASATAAAARAGQPLPATRPGAQLPPSMLHHALAAGISRGFLAAAVVALVALAVALATIRLRRDDLTGHPEHPTPQATVDR